MSSGALKVQAGHSLTANGFSGGVFNPAISLGLALIRALTPIRALILTVAQMLGSIAGAAITSALLPGCVLRHPQLLHTAVAELTTDANPNQALERPHHLGRRHLRSPRALYRNVLDCVSTPRTLPSRFGVLTPMADFSLLMLTVYVEVAVGSLRAHFIRH